MKNSVNPTENPQFSLSVDEQVLKGSLWSFWAEIANFTIDGTRIGDNPPKPFKAPGLPKPASSETRLDPKYREIILLAHTLVRLGYEAGDLHVGSPNINEPDLRANLVDRCVWLEHTDLCDERATRAMNTSLTVGVKVNEALTGDHKLRHALAGIHITINLRYTPTTARGVEAAVVAEILEWLRSYCVGPSGANQTLRDLDAKKFPQLNYHGAEMHCSLIPGSNGAVDMMYGTGAIGIPWPRGGAARNLIEEKRARTYLVSDPIWLVITMTNVDGVGDPTLPELATDPAIEIAPFERFVLFVDWHRHVIADRWKA